ncbi:uncharacterized protein LOC111704873 [Eurytemora carolleeae]|uniref:uncharacterized protein LOC111704873 n=1 Tax=Eurytemora carolleeae TaxID=1294199 RepID=UPI000C77604D|nr:uncharacterized protein LOC111704873 [Eurytemora carolleeae]|eukprot:XP_023333011.1 uncharacterized protein LOC111704873 [Eurytemora affinis]
MSLNPYSKKMVEKKAFQAHHRNISSVSEISVTIDPIKREDADEIKVIFLLDSLTERNMMFDLIHRYLQDGQSDIVGATLLNHHWEQPHRECTGQDCMHCIRSVIPGGGGGREDRRASDDSGLTSRPDKPIKTRHESYTYSLVSSHEGYFRFFLDGHPFRLMMLSKDKQNLLKIISFDFLVVCMQVKKFQVQKDKESSSSSCSASLDENIWEFEWKRLDKHSKKILAPIILLGYFRDILKLGQIGHGDSLPLDKIMYESKMNVQRVCRKYRAIPRFCDFVTGSSQELFELFSDIKNLFFKTGYILQQCALANNIAHFKMVMESVSCTDEDLNYQDPETGDNPVMIAAKLRHKDLVSDVLRSARFSKTDDSNFLERFIHSRNKYDQTLLHMVAIQGPELEEQKLLILRKEIEIHCLSELTHESDQLKLQRCLRSQLKSSAEAAIINEQSRALQGIPKTVRELKAEKGKIWSKLFFSTLFLSLIFNAIDTGSDILIMIRYFNELVGKLEISEDTCVTDTYPGIYNDTAFDCEEANWEKGNNITIKCFPLKMDPQSKFGYTLFFILVPWPFFIYEFFTSRHYENLKNKGAEIVEEMSQCNGIKSLLFNYLRLILHSITFVCCVTLWPIAVLFIKYYEDGKYYLSKGAKKVAREKKIETSEVLYSTARVMEVSLESSFQPTIQLYLLFPTLVQQIEGEKFVFQVFTLCRSGNIPVIKPDQTISIITSILSLSWCFTAYHATLKRGALDKDLAALFYRAVLFLSVLFQILGRLFIFVFFAYSFGPGRYYPLLIFLGAHIVLMSLLHFVFSDAKKYWQKGGFLNLSFFHYLIGNGLANIYIHNWIRMDPLLLPWAKPLQHVSTLVRQFLFDLIFIAENVVLLSIALNSHIIELREGRATYVVVLLGFQFVGLILKCVYYRYLHIWAWLIMDYTTMKQDGHWKCFLFSNMFLCGEIRERKLLLCCIPKPLSRLFNSIFGERKCGSNGPSCSLCKILMTVVLFPIAIAIALIAFVAAVFLGVMFMPVFIVIILPCLIIVKCRQSRTSNNIVKITESDSKMDNFHPAETERKTFSPHLKKN